MLYSAAYGYLFIHIPKTGGTSVQDALISSTRDAIGHGPSVIAKRFVHATLAETGERLDQDAIRRAYKFGFVRNPWDRAVSFFLHNQRLTRATMDFASFWRDKHRKDQFYRQQTDYLDGLDFIGRFENLKSDIERVATHLGLPKPNLQHLNMSSMRLDYASYYCDETKSIINDRYERDIEDLGYCYGT